MAVFPDRIVLKNSTDSQAAIETAIQTGGTDEITQGEIVLGIENTQVKFYTKSGNGNIVTLGGTAAGANAMGDLTDVDLSTPATDGQILSYNSTSGNWEPGAVGGYTDPLTTDGDIVIRSGGATTRLAIGTSGQVLRVSASGEPEWSTQGSGLDNIVEDATPQLGGDLDTNGSAITSPTNNNITLVAGGTSHVSVRSNSADGKIVLSSQASGSSVGIQSPNDAAGANYTLVLPGNDGINGQLLATDGSGNLAWSSPSGLTTWSVTANGTSDYIFDGDGFAGTETDPDLYVVRGQTYLISNTLGAHPFQIQSTQGFGGTAYNDGITNNGVSNGVLSWEVRMDAPSTLYYQCTSHADMNGTIYVLDEGSTVASIDDLGDVDTTTVAPTDGQALVWDAANSQWEPGNAGGSLALDDLSDVDTGVPGQGDVIAYNSISGNWESSAAPPADISANSINDLSDVDTSTTAPTDGQALLWDNAASKWEPGTVSGGGTTLPAAQDGEALIYENGQWVAGPVIGGVNYSDNAGDANFSDVEFLMNPEGSNGSTSFTDLSNNAATISVAGSPAISTSQYKFGSSSVYFNGSRDDYLSIPNASWMSFGSNDFTIECWVYINGNSNYNQAQNGTDDKRSTFLTTLSNTSGDANNSWDFRFDGNTTTTGTGLRFLYRQSNLVPINLAGTTSIAQQTWHHVAAVRNGNTLDLYLNGTSIASQDVTGIAITSTQSMVIGTERYGNQPSTTFDGYIDGLRITSGVARYTSAFTPPTEAFPETGPTITNIPYSIDNLDDVDTSTAAPTDGQALLWDNAAGKWEPGTVSSSDILPAAQDGEALVYENGQWVAGPVIGGIGNGGDQDFSNVAALLHFNGPNGSSTVTDSGPDELSITAVGSTNISTTQSKFGGSSMYFPGGQHLLFPATIAFNSDPFTIETWVYPISFATTSNIYSARTTGSGVSFRLNTSGQLDFFYGNGTSAFQTTTQVALNTWTHVAVTRDSNNLFTLWIDGVSSATNTITASVGTGVTPMIGKAAQFSGEYYQGYLDDFRITKGVCRYTANFTPPTAQFPDELAIPYSIDNLDDVDTSTVAPTDGQVLAWDNANSKWEPDSLRTLLGIGEYADDASAGTGGVASGALYYNTTSSDYRLKS